MNTHPPKAVLFELIALKLCAFEMPSRIATRQPGRRTKLGDVNPGYKTYLSRKLTGQRVFYAPPDSFFDSPFQHSGSGTLRGPRQGAGGSQTSFRNRPQNGFLLAWGLPGKDLVPCGFSR